MPTSPAPGYAAATAADADKAAAPAAAADADKAAALAGAEEGVQPWNGRLLNHSSHLNPMFGIAYNQPPGFNTSWCDQFGRRTPPPCNRYNYNRSSFVDMLEWLQKHAICEASLYMLQMPNATMYMTHEMGLL